MDSDYERSDLLSDPSVAYMTYADRKVMAQLDRRKWIPSSNSELTERQIGYLIGIRNIAHFVLMREIPHGTDRKSTRLNSSHANISYAVFCLTKKTYTQQKTTPHAPRATTDARLGVFERS